MADDDITAEAVLGEIAHIVGLHKGSARWRPELSDAERNAPENLLVLCGTHHRIIDEKRNERRYSEAVVLRMKREHEQGYSTKTPSNVEPRLTQETLTSSMLIVEALPATLFSARCTESDVPGVARKLRRSSTEGADVVPFYFHEERLWSFWDLRDAGGPLARAVDPSTADRLAADEAWSDPDSHRRYVAVLNKAMTLHLERRGLRRDLRHNRYYFAAREVEQERVIKYPTLRGRTQPLRVVREERRRTGERKGVWWHQALRFRFERIGEASWFATLRPEFHLSANGVDPLPERRVAGRVTRRKSTMYNEQYLNRVHFWRWFLTGGNPRVVIRAGQPIIISAEPVEVSVEWPGVPDDDAQPVATDLEETLLTLAERADAVGNMDDWEDLIA